MGWATAHIAKLVAGETVSFRPTGKSMEPLIRSGQLVTVEPVKDASEIRPGDAVLCRVHGREFLHLVKTTRRGQILIGNNRGHTNGWTDSSNIFGVVTKTSA